MKKLFFLLIIVNVLLPDLKAQTPVKYTKADGHYLMVLHQGDSVFHELEKLFADEKLSFATFTGFGFVNVEFGYFNTSKKLYKRKIFKNMELAAMQGSIAWQNGKPSIHAHGIGGDKNYRARAGHILSAEVSTGTLELVIIPYSKKPERKKDEALGANVLELVD